MRCEHGVSLGGRQGPWGSSGGSLGGPWMGSAGGPWGSWGIPGGGRAPPRARPIIIIIIIIINIIIIIIIGHYFMKTRKRNSKLTYKRKRKRTYKFPARSTPDAEGVHNCFFVCCTRTYLCNDYTFLPETRSSQTHFSQRRCSWMPPLGLRFRDPAGNRPSVPIGIQEAVKNK